MKRILVLEDEENLCRLYQQVLTEEGFAVVIAKDRNTALNLLERYPCDLAVVDIKLGTENGLDCIQEMLQRKKDLRIIIHSAYAVYKQDFSSWSADAYLLKSSDIDELVQTIHRLLKAPKAKANIV